MDAEVIALRDGQLVSFTGDEGRYDRFNKIGIAWNGGRKEFGGPVVEEAFPFTFRLAFVIDNHGGSSRESAVARETLVPFDALVTFEGLPGTFRVTGSAFAGMRFEPVTEDA